MSDTPFTIDEIDRYARQVSLAGWGAAGQERVRAASIAIAGDGATAEMAARYLVGAGVGRLLLSSTRIVKLIADINPHVAVEVATPPDALDCAGEDHARGAEQALAALRTILGLEARA